MAVIREITVNIYKYKYMYLKDKCVVALCAKELLVSQMWANCVYNCPRLMYSCTVPGQSVI